MALLVVEENMQEKPKPYEHLAQLIRNYEAIDLSQMSAEQLKMTEIYALLSNLDQHCCNGARSCQKGTKLYKFPNSLQHFNNVL